MKRNKRVLSILLSLIIVALSVFTVGCSSSDRDREDGDTAYAELTGFDVAKNYLDNGGDILVPNIDEPQIGMWELDRVYRSMEIRYEASLKNNGITVDLQNKIKFYNTDSDGGRMVVILDFKEEDVARVIYENAELLFGDSVTPVRAKKTGSVVSVVRQTDVDGANEMLNTIMMPNRKKGHVSTNEVIYNMLLKNWELYSPCTERIVISSKDIEAGCVGINGRITRYSDVYGKDMSPIQGKVEFYGYLRSPNVTTGETITVIKFKDESGAKWAESNLNDLLGAIRSPYSPAASTKTKRSGAVLVIAEASYDDTAERMINMAFGVQ